MGCYAKPVRFFGIPRLATLARGLLSHVTRAVLVNEKETWE
jgi:hypothetical protein